MATAPRPQRTHIVLPREPTGAVRVLVLHDSREYHTLAMWQRAAHSSMVLRPARRGAEKWWYGNLTAGEAHSFAQFAAAHGVKGGGVRRMSDAVKRAMNVTVHDGGVQGLGAEDADARPTLYFLHATGCPACEMMKPEVGAFYASNRDRIRVVPVDLAVAEWRAKKWAPEMTPTLIVRYPDGRLSPRLEGYEPGAFQKWVRKVLG
jgi:thiol-disulfide isomerase/thioredoxin